MGETFWLSDGRWKIVVAPSLGGSLVSCDHDGQPVLQTVGQHGAGAARCCYFPLIPYSNRVEKGRFTYGGLTVRLAQNVADSPHPMHGHGWQADWQVVERGRLRCELAFDQAAAPDWPWPYRGWQTIALQDKALRITLAIENLGNAAMPCGLGFHPFLPANGATRLRFEAGHAWNGRADEFPRERIAIPDSLDFRGGPRVAERRGTDHCFDGWPGRATVYGDNSTRAWLLEGCAQTPFVVVYIPAAGGSFCVEPVTHAINAMNLPPDSASGLWALPARAVREIRMTIRPLPAAAA
jgi:aldose 1-epimerase